MDSNRQNYFYPKFNINSLNTRKNIKISFSYDNSANNKINNFTTIHSSQNMDNKRFNSFEKKQLSYHPVRKDHKIISNLSQIAKNIKIF